MKKGKQNVQNVDFFNIKFKSSLSMEPVKLSRLLYRVNVWFRCRSVSHSTSHIQRATARKDEFRSRMAAGPQLKDFVNPNPASSVPSREDDDDVPHYITENPSPTYNKVYFETYGCQMNVNDTEIAWSILQKNGYVRMNSATEADVILLVTCSIREKAEQTIWHRLKQLGSMKRKRCKSQGPLRIGLLGCMAERLKEEILQKEKLVDVLAGPDAYRDLPRLLSVAETGQQAANVLLSLDETYADVMPVQTSSNNVSSFVSIMRGCDNMCTYCIVPFTRGRERSRPVHSILEEVRMLSSQVLYLIRERHNICKQIHIPAQSGSNRVLEAMRRGYTREAYLELVQNIREHIPGVSLSSDFIAGFCQETEEDHLQTLSLLREVSYNTAFLFAYSMRKKTRAFHRLNDDVPPEVKKRRLEELITVFREEAEKVSQKAIRSTQLVLVEGHSKRSSSELCGRNDGNTKVVFPDIPITSNSLLESNVRARPGDYVLVEIISSSSQSLRGRLLGLADLQSSQAYS
ncbi:mitochondrial tRNA methylthiotransferase CDK5RAP1 isoform X3 [Ranitomeya variabilis]|uniref:mitochondrial tRNA methylthiotransferase CDK5RAP1 isoform X3 n=1 Tax=Ranitomeya variabilis TaxID=490064 RepID=UPI004055BD17